MAEVFQMLLSALRRNLTTQTTSSSSDNNNINTIIISSLIFNTFMAPLTEMNSLLRALGYQRQSESRLVFGNSEQHRVKLGSLIALMKQVQYAHQLK